MGGRNVGVGSQRADLPVAGGGASSVESVGRTRTAPRTLGACSEGWEGREVPSTRTVYKIGLRAVVNLHVPMTCHHQGMRSHLIPTHHSFNGCSAFRQNPTQTVICAGLVPETIDVGVRLR